MSRSCFYTLELTYYLDRKWALPALFQFFTSLHIFNSYSCFKNCSAQLQLPAVATQCILASVIRDWCCTNSLWNLQFQCTDVILGNKVYCLTVKYPATTLNVWISQFIWLPIKKQYMELAPKIENMSLSHSAALHLEIWCQMRPVSNTNGHRLCFCQVF